MLNIKEVPIFDLGHFILRELREDDAQDFLNYYNNPEVYKYIISSIPKNLNEAIEEVKYWKNIFYRGYGVYFAIALKHNDQLIGSVGLTGYNPYHKRIEISYDLAREYWRKGISEKAIKKIINYGFSNLNIKRIEAYTRIENIPSYKLLEKANFKREGLLRAHRYYQREFLDVYLYSIINDNL